MPVFSKAQNFTVNGGLFTDQSITNVLSGTTGIETLLEVSCSEAAYDAAGREYSPRCFPGTREQYIEDIVKWAVPTLGDAATPMYWMEGPAGVGKSAVAQTCAEELKERNKLGAAFFFSINGRNKAEQLFPSIAYQLSTIHPPYYDLIDGKIRHDRTLVNKAMRSQFRYLIEEPLRELASEGKGVGSRIVVIIDGLDECKGSDAQCEIIRIIASAASDGTLPLCWAFFSRPEPHIEATFASTAVAPHCHKVVLPISREADGEIELYLKNGFENIIKRRNTSTESQWPSNEDMEILVGAAGGSFIYATTVLRFVDHLGSIGPQKRLCAIINVILDRRDRNPRAGTSTDMPFAELDAFYILILQRIPPEILPSVHLLLAWICRWGRLGAIVLANALELSKDEFETICNHASAVIHFENPGKDLEVDSSIDTNFTYTQIGSGVLGKLAYQVRDELGGRVSFYHKSFDDFLLDSARSGSYCVRGSEILTKHYLKMHLDIEQNYSWEGLKLVPAPGAIGSVSSLSYPYTNELVNSLLKAKVYMDFGIESPQTVYTLGALDSNRDFRKHLYVFTHFWSGISSLPHSGSLWGCKYRIKRYPGTQIRWIPLAEFNVDEFKSMVENRKQANVIQRYYPTLTYWIKSFFRKEPQEVFESALYRIGRGQKSIFWYWEFDYGARHYREFHTVDLAEGEKRFREEDFASWPEYGYEAVPKS